MTNWESFRRLDKMKKDIDKHRDKREVCIRLAEFDLDLYFLLFSFFVCLYSEGSVTLVFYRIGQWNTFDFGIDSLPFVKHSTQE